MNNNGFTIIEVVISIVIVVILASISFPVTKSLLDYNDKNKCISVAYTLRDAFNDYMIEYSPIRNFRIYPIEALKVDVSTEGENRNSIRSSDFLNIYNKAIDKIDKYKFFHYYNNCERKETVPIEEDGGVGETSIAVEIIENMKLIMIFEVHDAKAGEYDYALLKSFEVIFKDKHKCEIMM